MKRYGYTYAVAGDRWIEWYAGRPERIEALKTNVRESYYAQVPGPTTEPTTEVIIDEMSGLVRIFCEGFSTD